MIKFENIMNKTGLFILGVILCFACEKEYLIPKNEIPGWLKDKISHDEKIIKSDPKMMENYGAWIRYEFEDETYFEYDNPLSSTSRNPYSQEGTRINTTLLPFTEYWNNKCCEKFVWKAPKYHEL
jgi:hypothetical protein